MPEEPHVHSHHFRTWDGPQQVSEGRDWQGNFVVIRWHIEFYEEKCACGDVKSSGSTTKTD